MAGIDLECFCFRDDIGNPLVRIAHQHGNRGGHATLSRRAEGGTDECVQRLILVGVRHDDGVVLGTHHALRTLAVITGEFVYVFTDVARSDERHCLDIRMCAECIDSLFAAVDDVQHTGRHAGFDCQFREQHWRHRVLFGRLQHKGIAAGYRHREHPQRDHRRKIERGDTSTDANRLADEISVDATGDVLGNFTERKGADGARVLDHFQPTEHIAFRIRNGLALLGGETRGKFFHIALDKFLQL